MLRDSWPWIIVGIVVLALIIGGVTLLRARANPFSTLNLRRPRSGRDRFRQGEAAEAPPQHAAIIVNPIKVADLSKIKERITSSCHARGWGDPHFLETTVADPGHGQAKEAIEAGASVVCSLGGDGTVRSVASGLVDTEMPLGILPAGTGNLLARNLDLPVVDFDKALRVVLTGRNRRIDTGELQLGETDEHGDAVDGGELTTYRFLVMGGIGMDALIMGDTNDALKKTVGWPAYLLSGARHLVSPEFRVHIRTDAEPPFRRRARAVVIGNCGKLLGGLVLMPDARVDDRQLDVLIASPRGFVGWAPVFARMITRRRKGHPTLDHKVCREIRVRVDRPLPVQVDGDVVGESIEINAAVRPASLTVRVSLT